MATNRIKTLRLQQQNNQFSDPIVISPDASNVYLNNNKNLQEVLGNLNFLNGETLATRLQHLEQSGYGFLPTTTFSNLDTSKLYVYTGTDTSKQNKWFYYDGSNWVVGGSFPSTNFDALQNDISTINTKMGTVPTGKDLQSEINVLSALVGDGNSSDGNTLVDKVNNINNKIGINNIPEGQDLQSEIDDLKGKTTGTTNIGENIPSLQNQITAIKTEIGMEGSSSGTNLTSQINALQTGLTSLINDTTSDENSNSLQSQITSLINDTTSSENSNSLKNKIDNLILETVSENTDDNTISLKEEINSIKATIGLNEDSDEPSLLEQIEDLRLKTIGQDAEDDILSLKELIDNLNDTTNNADSNLQNQINSLTTNTLGDAQTSLKNQINAIKTEIGMNSGSDGNDSLRSILNDLIAKTISTDSNDNVVSLQEQISGLRLNQDDNYDLWIGNNSNNKTTLFIPTDTQLETGGKAADASVVGQRLSTLQREIDDKDVNIDLFSFVRDEETNEIFLKYGEKTGVNGIVITGGGGGGSQDTNNAIFTYSNTTGWISNTIAYGSECPISINWQSLVQGEPFGKGSAIITVNSTPKGNLSIDQGDVIIDLKPYLGIGENIVYIKIIDAARNSHTFLFNITTKDIRISSDFDNSKVYTESFDFPFKVYGSDISKTVHFIVDKKELNPYVTTNSGGEHHYRIPVQSHGAHNIEVYFTGIVNNQSIQSNHLYYEFIFEQEGNSRPIVISSYQPPQIIDQYSSINIPYRAYTPNQIYTPIRISVNGKILVNDPEVDKSTHNFIHQLEETPEINPNATAEDESDKYIITIQIVAGSGSNLSIPKTFIFYIKLGEININAITENLSLYLSPKEKYNTDLIELRQIWKDTSNNITANLEGFNWSSDGWMNDNENAPILRLQGGDLVTIPVSQYQMFNTNIFETNGRTIEFEFSTRNVADYDSEIIKCINIEPIEVIKKDPNTGENMIDENTGEFITEIVDTPVGFSLTSKKATLSSQSTSLSINYKDNEHVRVTFVIYGQQQYRLMMIYIDGIASACINYGDKDIFKQSTAQGITIGSPDCGVDLYNIRIYNKALNRRQIVNNWIADTYNISQKIRRFNYNKIYSIEDDLTNLEIDFNKIPQDVPYMVFQTAPNVLPTYKIDSGTKPKINGYYRDPMDETKSFDFINCQINVQGTSSSVYARKNYDLQFKSGFNLINPEKHENLYALTSNDIPFNRFVLKADVASSQGANNVELVKLFNDICQYDISETVPNLNPKARWGINGIPILLFWQNTDNNEITFMGKYNFNHPKRASIVYGYGNPETFDINDPEACLYPGLESWEVENNDTSNVQFQSANFSSLTTDGRFKWWDDFEARFPTDTYRDDQGKLQEFVTWVNSTYREAAQNQSLTSPVEYTLTNEEILEISNIYNQDSQNNEITVIYNDKNQKIGEKRKYRYDTPTYRLVKFKKEAENYLEIDSACFYYIFTLFFLLMDSRAKNMFLGFRGGIINDSNRNMNRKVVFQPYDMDTAIGINNSGDLLFDYYLEDIDQVPGYVYGKQGNTKENVYNGQRSVLWTNIKDAFPNAIKSMYQTLRVKQSTGKALLDYDDIIERFESHQSKWSEAIFNEDANFKYIIPLTEPLTYDETLQQYIPTTMYLHMLQGSKKQQRRYWLRNRFQYMDSKFVTGNAAEKRIYIRFFNNGILKLKSAINMYLTVTFGGGKTPITKRSTIPGEEVSFEFTNDEPYIDGKPQQVETWIYSGDYLSSVGDLRQFKPNECNFSSATKLKELYIGGYENDPNDHLRNTNFDLSHMPLLENLDISYAPNLTLNVNIEDSIRLKKANFKGSSISGVDLAEGCLIEELYLPATIRNLVLMDLKYLSQQKLTIQSLKNVTTLMLSNIDSNILDPLYVLSEIHEGAAVNIKGFMLDLTGRSQTEAENILETQLLAKLADKTGVMRQKVVDNYGVSHWNYYYNDYPTALISGTIKIDKISGSLKTRINKLYPSLKIEASQTTFYVHYYNINNMNLPYNSENLTQLHTDGPFTIRAGQTILQNQYWPYQSSFVVPTRTDPNDHYQYTYEGWSNEPGGITDLNIFIGIEADKNVYAAYRRTGNTYTVKFFNSNNALLATVSDIEWGATISYPSDAPTPVHPNGANSGFVFSGWDHSLTNITSSFNCYAQYEDRRSIVSLFLQGDLTNIDLSTTNSIANYSFYKYPQTLNINQNIGATTIGYEAFDNTRLKSSSPHKLVFPNAKTFNIRSLYYPLAYSAGSGYELWDIELKNTTDSITLSDNCFANSEYGNSNFCRLIIDNPNVITIGNNSLPSPFWTLSGGIFVQSNLVDAYRNRYQYHIFAKEDYGNVQSLNYETISDSWSDIIAYCNDSNHTYRTRYKIGDIKKFTLNNNGNIQNIYAKLIGIDKDTIYETSNKAHLTWLSYSIGNYPMHNTTSTIDGWKNCQLRTQTLPIILQRMPIELQENILTVTKTFYNADLQSVESIGDQLSIPSYFETKNNYDTGGIYYINNKYLRQLNKNDDWYWTRTAYNSSQYRLVSQYSYSYSNANSSYPIRIMFCI